MRLYILGASAWLVIGVRFAFHGLRNIATRSRLRGGMQLRKPEPTRPESNNLLDQDDLDPRIARIIDEIPRRRVRRHA